jgi:NADH-quinone oxidoreductase subunit E
MSVRRLAEKQPESFAFTPENLAWAKKEMAKYPEGRQASAVISLLWRAQDQDGWVTEPAIRAIAELLGMARIRVLEVATFYTMFNLEPVGIKAHIQLCGTTPCWLRGANELKDVCRRRIGDQHHLSEDGAFSWEEVECLGACVNAPLVQIGSDTYEDLTAESFEKLIDDIAAGRPLTPGPQINRQLSAPVGGPTSLLEDPTAPAAARTDSSPATDADEPKKS